MSKPKQIRLNFAPPLVPLVLSGEKTVTWRINDEKNIFMGDILSLHKKGVLPNGKFTNDELPFAKAKVVKVIEKPFSRFTEEDLHGHEQFPDKETMIKTYQGYYPDANITLETLVKIITFKLQTK